MVLNIDKILAAKGMRMADLATRIGIDQSNLKRSLGNNPTLSRLVEIADALDVSVRDLFPETPPSLSEGVLRVGNRHFALVPVDIPEPSYKYDARRFFTDVEALLLKGLKDGKTLSICGIYREICPFGLVYDGKSRKAYLTFAPNGDKYTTNIYEPEDSMMAKSCFTDESAANYVARWIVNDIEEML